jgi:hypothetical protein
MHDILGLDRLAGAPAVLSGYRSLERHPALSAARLALRNLRLMGVSILSDVQLQDAVTDARVWEEEHSDDDDYTEPPFEISTDPATGFKIVRERVRRTDPRRVSMRAALLGILDQDTYKIGTVDLGRPFRFRLRGGDGPDVICDARRIPTIPPPPVPSSPRRPRPTIRVTLAELESVATNLDAEDAAYPGRIPRNFLRRLRALNGQAIFSILGPSGGDLAPQSELVLDGTSHMIGLPGAGKSTLIFLLIVHLARQGKRLALLVPSIEFALAIEADLALYQVSTALLVGQSPDARRRHATRLAERIGVQPGGGFGQTAPGAELLGTRCALAGFVSVPPATFDFPHDAPPCTTLRQTTLKKDGSEGQEGDRSCALAVACGRQRSSRRLADPAALVHIGHIISTDTSLSPHFHTERMRHFERIARTCDLVIVDEADGAQAALDRMGIAELDLFGATDSYEAKILEEVFAPVARGRGFVVSSSVENYTIAATTFMKLNRALRVHLLERMREEGGLLSRFREAFVTGNTILAAIYLNPELDEDEKSGARFEVIRRLFDALVRSVLANIGEIGDDGEDLSELDLPRVAQELGIDLEHLRRAVDEFRIGLSDFLRAKIVENFQRSHDRMRESFYSVLPPRQGLDPEEARVLFRFLVEVTTVVLQFLALVPAQFAMISEGVHSDRIFGQRSSTDLLRNMPESLVGRLSGIRFAYETDELGRRSLRLQYVSFAGVPRMLLYHLSDLTTEEGIDGPAVLLASATSYISPSPSYHIALNPSIILRREGEREAWRDSVYSFRPVPDPEKAGAYVRLSGAGTQRERERSMRLLTDHFFGGSDPLVARMCADSFDPPRRVAIVVNSYEQVRLIKAHLKRTSAIAPRVIGVTADIRDIPSIERAEWLTASQVEGLGARDDWDAIIFPMRAIGRGVNIVFPDGPRVRDAAIGTVAFFVRPHPTADSLAFTSGVAGRLALDFDQQQIEPAAEIPQLIRRWRNARDQALDRLRRLLRRPQRMSSLGDMVEPFVADGMVDLLQTIGRAMRNGCKTRVLFVDAAFAPRSAVGQRDTARTSMIVAMRDVLNQVLRSADPIDREIYRLLYEPFLEPLSRCEGVIFP